MAKKAKKELEEEKIKPVQTGDPSKVFYLNMDDSPSGIAAKARIAHEAGFQMLAVDHKQFGKDVFYRVVREMVDTGCVALGVPERAHGQAVRLD